MTGKMNEILCRIDNFLQWFTPVLKNEYAEIDHSRAAIPRQTAGGTQKLARRNDTRRELWICNHSDVDLYLGLTDDIGALDYSTPIAPKDTLIISAEKFSQLHKKEVYGFWGDNPQDETYAMITEFFISK